ncbi:MAG: phosphatidylglycerol lysyltransferase domain-containing protein [Spirochaetaceae bacterium]|nr:phosphatidylglycerol lysyltransferase domain-containing protein [Spirochaetaceae bacterium]
MVPRYPEFVPIALEHGDAIRCSLDSARDGVSEFTFAGLYLFRKRYNYHISFVNDTTLIVSGTLNNKKFFMTPQPVNSLSIIKELFTMHDYWKNISDSVLECEHSLCNELGIEIAEDRDNFDYLYFREDLAKLSGKKFHKKRNLVNAFLLSYPVHDMTLLTVELIPQAIAVLDRWREEKQTEGDYTASREALEHFPELSLEGALFYVNGRAAAYCLGERVAQGTIFVMHFEKALEEYKGIYQYVNQSFAESLDEQYTYINREQDLGDEGLRQAKMTYRPAQFVKKYTGTMIKK